MIKIFYLSLLMTMATSIRYDFNETQTEWFVVVDGVMGGLSKGELQVRDGKLHFYGKVSLENNGGFASIRNPYGNYDLSKFTKVILRYKSTGNRMALTLNSSKQFYRPYYKFPLSSTSDWQEISIPLKEFKAYQLSDPLGYNFQEDQYASILRFGFITNDKEATSFDFKLDYIFFE